MFHQLAQKHEPIAHKLASGAGIDLMYVDSQITEKLIEKIHLRLLMPNSHSPRQLNRAVRL